LDRLFLDANVLFSAAYRADAGVARLWDREDAELLSSDYAIEEARRNLSGSEQVARLAELLRQLPIVPSVVPHADTRREIELPEKDWPILGAAIAAGATHLITGDKKDFGRFFESEILGVRVLPPSSYLNPKR
jgi:predicted nucleic acid-binding protein